MNKRDYLIIFFLFLLGISTRFPLIEKMQSHWDGPSWSIGIVRYSLLQETPAPPGYPLYIFLGKIANYFTHDPHTALLSLSVLFSGITSALFYIAGKHFFNKSVGIISAILYLSGPTFYFFGLTAYPYGLLPACAVVSALVVYFIVIKRKEWGILLGVLFSFIIGIRPQEFLFLFPLLLYGMYYLPHKQRTYGIYSMTIFFLVWFIPLVISTGGFFQYLSIVLKFAHEGALPNPNFFRTFNEYGMILKGFYLSFGIGLFSFLFYFYNLKKNWNREYMFQKIKNKEVLLFIVWMIPSLIFNVFVRSDHAGHQMTYLSALVLLVSYGIWKIFNNKSYLIYIVGVIAVFNLYTFFRDRDPQLKQSYIPTSFHYSEIKKNDIRLETKLNYIKEKFSPTNTLVITSSILWRPAMYYLPKYLIYDFSGITTNDSRFRYVARSSKNWTSEEYQNKNLSFFIPSHITNIIFIEDESNDWSINRQVSKIKLNGNAWITVMHVKEYDNFLYKKGVVTQL